MAIFEQQTSRKALLDDNETLSCFIENWHSVNGHTEYVIRVQRGPSSNSSWKISKRYNDFVKLHAALQPAGHFLPLPPKKIIGNMEPAFITERQLALQKYLNVLVMNPILVSSLPARSFVDPANYCQPFSEVALQHVSLALRGEVGWEVVTPLPEIGWRLRKHYYHVRSKNVHKEELWANWVDYGPDKYLSDKDMHAICKSLTQIQHPYIHKIELCLSTDVGGLVVRSANKNGSLRDLICGAKPRQSFMKKYGNPKGHKKLELSQIALYGRQILEALKFLNDKGLPYGHLHPGNVIIDDDEKRVKLLDIENGIWGVSSFYRPYFMQHRKINSLLSIDVYCFGHLLYEMTFGSPLHESVVENGFPEDCPEMLRPVLDSILSSEACKTGLPTLDQLLQLPFFAGIKLELKPTDKAHLKIPNATKDNLKIVTTHIEERLKEEQKMVRSQKRLARVQEMMSSEEEKKKQRQKMRHEQKIAKEKQQMRQKTIDKETTDDSKDKDNKLLLNNGSNGINNSSLNASNANANLNTNGSSGGDRSDSVNSSAATSSVGTATPPSMSGSSVPSPPPPPPPPAMGLPLPPPPLPLGGGGAGAASNGSNGAVPKAQAEGTTKDRSALLGAICNFNKDNLRKTTTTTATTKPK